MITEIREELKTATANKMRSVSRCAAFVRANKARLNDSRSWIASKAKAELQIIVDSVKPCAFYESLIRKDLILAVEADEWDCGHDVWQSDEDL